MTRGHTLQGCAQGWDMPYSKLGQHRHWQDGDTLPAQLGWGHLLPSVKVLEEVLAVADHPAAW